MATVDGFVEVCGGCGKANRVPYARLTTIARCGGCRELLRSPGAPIEVNSQSLQALLRAATVPVVVDFWASWCPPCRALAPQLDQVARKLAADIVVAKLNVDDSPDAAARYGARAIPLLVMFVDGKAVWRSTGARGAAQLESELRQALSAHAPGAEAQPQR